MPAAEALVVDASAIVEALLGSTLGRQVRERMRGCRLHAPAHLDAEVLSALGRLHRAGELDGLEASAMLTELAAAPIYRHPLADLLASTWERRNSQRLVDGLYVELAIALGAAALLTTDARLARSEACAELIGEDRGGA